MRNTIDLITETRIAIGFLITVFTAKLRPWSSELPAKSEARVDRTLLSLLELFTSGTGYIELFPIIK